MRKFFNFLHIILAFFMTACASYLPQFSDKDMLVGESSLSRKPVHKTFYLLGDAGGNKKGPNTKAIQAFKEMLTNETTTGDYAIFLGDNIYPDGLPSKNDPDRKSGEDRLSTQLNTLKNFNGETFFIPGNHDWYNEGLKGLKRQEKYIEKALGNKNAFQPENGCPIEKIDVSDTVSLIILDTQWYLEDWDRHPTMNDECNIRTRESFFLEIENEFKKNNEKTIIVAMHHPMYTNGIHGGKYSARKHLFPTQGNIPLPGIASLVTLIRSQGGVSIQDRYNKRYNDLMKRLSVLAENTDKVIFTSGHEHGLQYIEKKGIKQIVSGSGAKKSAVALGKDGLFAFGGQGFAVLDIYEDESSSVRYFSAEGGKPSLLYQTDIYKPRKAVNLDTLPTTFPKTVMASVYDNEKTEVSGVYKSLWGDHYREVYGTPIEVPVVTLDTLMGGFRVDRKGGGHQTRSLRLIDKNGRNFNLRAVRKSAVQFLQTVAFKETFVQEEFRDTFTEDIIYDFYTSAHPYATLAISDLADAVGVYHTNPKLIYVPKHTTLGKYNDEYGDELYIIEERPDNGFLDEPSFGNPDAIESTSNLYENLRDDEEYRLDEDAYIKARVFDMLLGDWDRHADQWRWSRFDINGKKIYRPIPRDRDQVFSKFDGALLGLLKTLLPAAKQFQNYDGDLKNIKWLNEAGIKMDRAILKSASKDEWLTQAQHIRDNISDEVIDIAFTRLPKEVQKIRINEIKKNLRERRDNIVIFAGEYYDYLSKLVIITATDKDDHFEITREDDGTRVAISRIKDGEVKKPFIERFIKNSETNEIWLYGLDDDDFFRVSGTGKSPVKTRIIGGQNNDVYEIQNSKGLVVYEHRSKENTIKQRSGARVKKSNIYNQNTYDPLKRKSTVNNVLPAIGFNPDDGFLIGLSDVFTTKGFKNDPYASQHTIKGGYYFATSGFDIDYEGVFANALGQWNLTLGGRFTNDSFARNFFGFGNDSKNLDDDLGLDYNRVRNGNTEIRLGVTSDNLYGSKLRFTSSFERVEIGRDTNRFIVQDFIPTTTNFYEGQSFLGVESAYTYVSSDNAANPSRGMEFQALLGSKINLDDTDRMYAYIKPKLGFYNALTTNRKLVLKTLVQAHINIGDDFEFYQAASLGANTGLRGYRFQRFTGESSFAGSADLRYSFKRFKTGLVPIQIGVFWGGDIGRVWLDGEDSDTWHNDFGGGFWINMIDTVSGQIGAFNSKEGMRIDFRFGVRL